MIIVSERYLNSEQQMTKLAKNKISFYTLVRSWKYV